ncbi:MAG TPA: preprotein translocase subunit YajC, partial [Planctomycetota bacterium]|nr:preprotein translocase subunit YajC [Planctomycetota bacterium]
TGLWPILLVIGIMYLVILRPERKRQKDLTKMRSELKKGDRIVTSSGILGTVAAIADDVVTVEIADKVRVQFQRGSVSQILEPKAEPAAAK